MHSEPLKNVDRDSALLRVGQLSALHNSTVRHGSPSEWILESKGVLESRSDILEDRSDG